MKAQRLAAALTESGIPVLSHEEADTLTDACVQITNEVHVSIDTNATASGPFRAVLWTGKVFRFSPDRTSVDLLAADINAHLKEAIALEKP